MCARILAAQPHNVSALVCRAVSDWARGADIERCIADLKLAAELAPENASVHHNLGTLLASYGESGQARVAFERALEIRPDDAEAFYGLAQNQRFSEETPVVRRMLELYARGALTPAAQEFACFGLAKVYDDLGKADRAMHFCLEANWLAHRDYDMAAERARIADLRAVAASGGLDTISDSGNPTRAPVFIVGMPRSGTTLVETILSRHPDVYAGGEMTTVPEIEKAALTWLRQSRGFDGGPVSALAQITADLYARNAAAALEVVGRKAGRPFRVFTDKTPDNAMRLGLIAKLFPRAKIVHVRRHPVDCCVSNLFMRFSHGQGFAFRQDWLGEHHRHVSEAMALWREALPLEILDLGYERLVGDPETETRRLLDFVGLDWDPACLAPERARRGVLTASQWQVRQPIHGNSVDRWRRYEEWLSPLISALGGPEWIEAEAAAARSAGTEPAPSRNAG